jgi:imidazolonepropionase-like amidohydrolase
MTLLISGGTLIDGTGRPPVKDGAVLIEGERVVAAGARSSFAAPESAELVDVAGGYILPGLIDTHVHLTAEEFRLDRRAATPFSLNFYQTIDRMRRTLEAGITTVRDAGGADLGLKLAVEQGLVAGPRMQISISALTITGGHGDGWTPSGMETGLFATYPGRPDGRCDGVEQVRAKVREVLRAGAEVIKVHATGGVLSPTDNPRFTQFSLAELEVMVAEGADRGGVKVMAHAQGAAGVKRALRAGIHSIEHGIYLDQEAIELFLERGAFLVPTLLAPVSVLEQADAHPGALPEWGVRKAREVIQVHKESVAEAVRAGVKVAMGTDAGVMPHGQNLRELELMRQVGMEPMQVLVATTAVAAGCLGWQDRVGTLEPGKLADAVVLRKDPLADLAALADPAEVRWVLKGGRWVKADGKMLV